MTMNPPIKVLIADDESIVRKGLIATTNWAQFNMEVIADVPNGQKCLEAFREHRPDIIITDIVMPELTGIEVLKLVKQEAPSTKVILLSCHRDFEYAQQGLHYGASGYLLKTEFEDEDLVAYLLKFQEELTAAQAPIISAKVDASSSRFESSFYAWLCGFQNEFRTELLARWSAEWHWMEEPHCIYLVKSFGDESDQSVWDAIHSQLSVRCERIRCGTDRCYYFVSCKDQEIMNALLKQTKRRMISMHWSAVGPVQGVEAWLSVVRKLHQEAELEQRFGLNLNSWPDAITQAIQLVAADLKEPWSVSEVAYRVGLSRSHFSTLFKKVTGMNFIELLYQMRLRVAMDLLTSTPMTLQNIAEQIGMEDGKYLSKWFKRYCGRTPSQYRTEQKEEK